jgi:phosphoglycolate phosphatase-like HAD superfamily hydrolase
MRARGYKPFGTNIEQDALLDRIIAEAKSGTVGVFDLDGCLFDTRIRLVTIFHEFASVKGSEGRYFAFAERSDFTDWDLKKPLRKYGMSESKIDAIFKEFIDFWWKRFFSDEYVAWDDPMPGATDLVRACHDKGMHIVYLTGRDHNMRAGTESALRRCGFPYDIDRTVLFTKPKFEMEDTAYKMETLEEIAKLGTVVVSIDNEPANINSMSERFPDALCVHIETDHSFREDRPYKQIPRLRSFYRTTSPLAEESDFLS